MGICKPLESMPQLAGELGALLDRPVLDMTGLTGRYAYFLTWIADRGENSLLNERRRSGRLGAAHK
jgi:uncharacterized protein (TIGR03435 family)